VLDGRTQAAGSLALGAIRNHCLVGASRDDPNVYIARHREFCDQVIRRLPGVAKSRLVATGGTVKALATTSGRDVVALADLRETILRAVERGAPECLSEERREVFAPGLIVLERLAAWCRAEAVEHGKNSVKQGMAARLIELTKTLRREDLHVTLILRTMPAVP
jgi:exopolyphosphatase/pppGpp-phosphohydrolase